MSRDAQHLSIFVKQQIILFISFNNHQPFPLKVIYFYFEKQSSTDG